MRGMVIRMKRIMSLVMWVCLVSAAFAEPMMVDGIAARVNSGVITVGEVIRMMMPAQQDLARQFKGEALTSRLRTLYADTLNSLIERKVILDSYEQQDMKIPEWVVDERVDEIVKNNFKGDRSELMTVLSRERVSFAEWRERWRERMIIASMRSSFVVRNINVPPKDIRERYDRDEKKYEQSEKVKLRMIFFRTANESRAAATEVLKQLASGQPFADMARKHSSGSRAASGGDWGWVEPDILRKEIVEAVSKMGVGDMSGVIETKKGLYIVKLEDRNAEMIRSFDSVRAEIEEELRAEDGDKLYKAWVKRLRNDAYIKIADIDLFRDK